MRARVVIAGAFIAAFTPALAPALAHASATRLVQAVDSQTVGQYWTPSAQNAQIGDSVEWKLTQPGNPIAGEHNIWIIKPGADPSTAVQLGTTSTTPTVTAPLDTDGVYTYYCSIHGGLAPGGMHGTITVGDGDAGAVIDPGSPWTDPNAAGAPAPTGPAPLLNSTTAPVTLETGDVTPPRVIFGTVKPVKGGVRVSFRATRPGTATVRVLRGWKAVKSRKVKVTGGSNTFNVADKHALKAGTYRVQVVLTDASQLASVPRSKTLKIKR